MTPLDLSTLPGPVQAVIIARATAARQTRQECAAALLTKAVADLSHSVSPMSLTPKQAELLAFIEDYAHNHSGIVPSFAEMQDGVGLKSKSGVNRLINALEERGAIRRMPFKTRAIEIVRSPS